MITEEALRPGQPLPQRQQQVQPISIRELCSQPHRFNINPPYQRGNVWPKLWKQQLLESIFTGLDIGFIKGYKYYNDQGESCWEIVDGHQRLSAIWDYYRGAYRTWNVSAARKAHPLIEREPIAPGTFFSKLDPYIRSYFLDYYLSIAPLPPQMTAAERATHFFDIQRQKGLTSAEVRHIYPSRANAVADQLATHRFWSDFYIGKTGNKDLYITNLYLIGMQLAPHGLVDFRASVVIPSLSSGKFDYQISDELVLAIEDNLDAAYYLFQGMQFSSRLVSIPMYQAILLLREAGIALRTSGNEGILAHWITNIIAAARRQGSEYPSFQGMVKSMLYKSKQEQFWNLQGPRVISLLGGTSPSTQSLLLLPEGVHA